MSHVYDGDIVVIDNSCLRHHPHGGCVTWWGGLQAMMPAFPKKCADEAIAYVIVESLVSERSLVGSI